jgi:DegV family protein with EDD domain
MGKIRIFTDSACDIPKTLVNEYNIGIVPVYTIIGEKSYKDEVELSREDFKKYINLDQEHFPTTSQPSVGDFVDKFKESVEKGESIISINLSSKLSGTYRNACSAAEILKKQMNAEIDVIDSESVSLGIGLVVLESAKMAYQGLPKNEIISKINEIKKILKVYIVINNISYLVKGGRLSKGKAWVAGMLNYKPILTFTDGAVVLLDKPRGYENAIESVYNYIEKQEKKFKLWGVIHVYAPELTEKIVEDLKTRFGAENIIVNQAAPALSVHAGPGVVGIITG